MSRDSLGAIAVGAIVALIILVGILLIEVDQHRDRTARAIAIAHSSLDVAERWHQKAKEDLVEATKWRIEALRLENYAAEYLLRNPWPCEEDEAMYPITDGTLDYPNGKLACVNLEEF